MTVLRVVENRTVMRVIQRDVANTIRVTSRDNKIVFRTTQRGIQGIQGEQGIQGVPGTPGSVGQGVPTGGTTGQILAKNSNSNYDTEWIDEQDLSGFATTTELTTGLAGKANTVHTHTASQVTDFNTAVAANSAVVANTAKISFDSASSSKLAGIEAGAEVNNISDANATDLTDAGDSTLHFHSADRNRANHTGTQTASTISDFQSTVSANASVVANTAKVTNQTHTGDVTGATALTIANNAVTNAKAAQMATKTYKGRTSSGTGNAEDVAVATLKTDLVLVRADVGLANVDNTSDANKPVSTAQATADGVVQSFAIQRVNHTGTQTASTISDFASAVAATAAVTANTAKVSNATHTGDVTGATALTIANDAVSYAKMQNVSAASRLIGRGDSGSGDPQEITLGTNLSMTGTTLNATGGGGGSPAGVDGSIQINTAGSFADVTDFTFDGGLNVPGNIVATGGAIIQIEGTTLELGTGTGSSATIDGGNVSDNRTYTLPDSDGTLATEAYVIALAAAL